MSERKKWKSRLLSSSIPLEYEVAKVLSDLNFSISFDYPYYRREGEQEKEFSTDIKGYFLFPLDSKDEIDASLTLVAECKYREESKKWVFLPDVNRPDFSNFIRGYTIKSLSEFSNIKNREDFITSFEDRFDFALKGVEINFEKGDVFNKDILHGISQLKFALPYLIKDTIEENVFGHLDDSKPAYLISILVTNADLYILNDNFSIERVKEVEELEEMAKKVPYLICHSETGPDFMDHHKKIFENFHSDCEEGENLKKLEAFQKTKKKVYGYDSPIRTCIDLEESFYFTLQKYYSQHFICSFEHFNDLVNQILKLLNNVTKVKRQ